MELLRMGLLEAQVCSGGTWDEALDWIRRENPAGKGVKGEFYPCKHDIFIATYEPAENAHVLPS